MNFQEAIDSLNKGESIRRKSWDALVHLKIVEVPYDNGEVEQRLTAYRQEAVPFTYNKTIMVSTDWVVCGTVDEITFPAAVEMLKKRFKVRLKAWAPTTFLELAPDGKELFMRKLCEYDYTPSFECFSATDWELYE